jgi:hypothetical protein
VDQKKPDPQTIAAGREPKPVRVTTGEILAILFNFIPIAAGILPIAALALVVAVVHQWSRQALPVISIA